MAFGKFVAEYSPGSLSGYSNWWEAVAPVADLSISDCGASNARSSEIEFCMTSSSVVLVSVMYEKDAVLVQLACELL